MNKFFNKTLKTILLTAFALSMFSAVQNVFAYGPTYLSQIDLKSYVGSAKEKKYGGEELDIIAKIYYLGRGIDRLSPRMFSLLKKSAMLGDPEAQAYVAVAYFYGQGVETDIDKAIRFAEMAAQRLRGSELKNIEELLQSFKTFKEKSNLTKESNITKDLHLPLIKESIIKNAKLGGDPWAQYQLAEMYTFGTKDISFHKEAFKLFEKAAEQGLAHAQYKLAFLYYYGQGVELDINKAMEWMQKAADNNAPRAQQELLNFKEDKKTFGKLLKAAKAGDVKAQYKLADLYVGNRGVKQDLKESIKWYLEAIATGHTDAEHEVLQLVNYYGKDIEQKDMDKVIKWARKAVKQDNATWVIKSYLLAIFRDYGVGIDQENIDQAIKWVNEYGIHYDSNNNKTFLKKLEAIKKSGNGCAKAVAKP